jgi:hypothetical protein
MKRFIATELWQKPWYMELSPAEKCAWIYLTTNVDAVGVWTPNPQLANFTIGAEIDWEALLTKLNSNVKVLKNGKWWLPDFCEFQYGKLVHSYQRWAAGEELRGPHKFYIELLMKHGLIEEVVNKGYTLSGMGTRKGKGKRKGLEKEKVKEKEKEKEVSRPIYHLIQNAFLAHNQDYEFKRESPHVVQLEKKALARPDPEEFIKKAIVVFWQLVHSKDKYWQQQPFLPSILNSGGLWPRVLKRLEQMEGQVIDAETRRFLEELF